MSKELFVEEGYNGAKYYDKDAVDALLAEKDKEIESLKASHYAESVDAGMRERRLRRALWNMTAEWADAMGLASCNIAAKFRSREQFEVSDDYRNKTIKKYKHRQVVFCKYADYCRAKAEKFKEAA